MTASRKLSQPSQRNVIILYVLPRGQSKDLKLVEFDVPDFGLKMLTVRVVAFPGAIISFYCVHLVATYCIPDWELSVCSTDAVLIAIFIQPQGHKQSSDFDSLKSVLPFSVTVPYYTLKIWYVSM